MGRAWIVFAALLLVPLASAYEEAEAAARWEAQFGVPLAVETAHAPQLVREGEQFTATLRFPEGHNVTGVHYQVCVVAESCIIAPRPATRVEADAWRLDTADFVSPLDGRHHTWKAGQWLGVQWFVRFAEEGPLHEFPRPLPDDDPLCQEDFAACSATHYFTFHMVPADRGAPFPHALWAAVGLLLLVWRRRGGPA